MVDDTRTPSSQVKKLSSGIFKMPRPVPAPPPPPRAIGFRLRTKLVIAMIFAALVPVVIVASIATGVILSNLDAGLREDADRQLTVGLNLLLRSVERFGDEAVQLSESSELVTALRDPKQQSGLERWLSRQVAHIPSARLQLLDASGTIVFDRMIVGALTCDPAQRADANHPECRAAGRFAEVGVNASD